MTDPNDVSAQLTAAMQRGDRAVIVDSPPGAGKSTLIRTVARSLSDGPMLPVITQTNVQADDQIRGFLRDADRGAFLPRIGRLHAGDYVTPVDLAADGRVQFSSKIDDLRKLDIVVGTAAKWGALSGFSTDQVLIDEGYQMRSDALIAIGRMTGRIALVGDPGQLAPYTEVDETHLRALPVSPIENAAATLLKSQPNATRLALPTSRRLDGRAAPLISDAFYALPFQAHTPAGERTLRFTTRAMPTREARAVEHATEHGWAMIELPARITPEVDPDVVSTIIASLSALITTRPTLVDENGERPLVPADIAIGVSHHSQEYALQDGIVALAGQLGSDLSQITIDTANKLQGREYAVVIVWHPMSGRREGTPFHVDAGRLCVLLSRHRQMCIVVGRAGIQDQLDAQLSLGPVWTEDTPLLVDPWQAQMTALERLQQFAV